ncbi:MAG: hypothetical protein RLZZ336_437 [Cyanobacteriota bacterium]|jgi:hypothetical protein
MAWHTRKSTRSSFGGSSTYRYGSLEPGAPEDAGDGEFGSAAMGRTRLRSSAKEQELKEALKAGATPTQLRQVLAALETLAAGLGSEQLLDWSVRFEPGQRTLCLRWRQRDPGDSVEALPWQTRRFGGKAGGASGEGRSTSSRGFG